MVALSAVTPIASGREIELTLERTIERGLRFITNVQRNPKHSVIGGLEQSSTEL
jgi:hypothetical protein